jgi:hypothetical protein
MAQSRADCRTTVDARFLVFFVVTAAHVGACGGEIGHRAPVGAGTGAASGTAGASGTGANGGGGVIPPPGTDPGRVTLHRLNRVEYDNTVRDLLGTTATPAKDFPADDRGYGLDNLADILTLSPVHINLYQATAESLVTQALAGTQRAKIAICDPATGEACVRSILKSFARKAWASRRPWSLRISFSASSWIRNRPRSRLTRSTTTRSRRGCRTSSGPRCPTRRFLRPPTPAR